MGVIKSGKVVIVLQGRFAGRKAIVVKAYDDGNAENAMYIVTFASFTYPPPKSAKRR